MKKFDQSFKTFWTDEEGASAIEYGLLASLIALAIVTGASALGLKLDELFQGVADTLVVPS
jgi:pilus assembly protein Flp/PilA